MKRISEHTIIGIAACAGVYLFVFIYLQVSSYTGFGKKTQFNTYSKLEDDEIRLTADNIEAGDFMGGDETKALQLFGYPTGAWWSNC